MTESSNDRSGSHPPSKSKKSSDNDKYVDCGKIKTKKEDKNLPDIEQSTLEPVKSNIPECYDLKLEYDKCFNHWFSSSFIRGSKKKSPCDELLMQYTSCVQKGLRDQNFELFQTSCYMNYTTDPNDGKQEHPRKSPPAGATTVT